MNFLAFAFGMPDGSKQISLLPYTEGVFIWVGNPEDALLGK